MFVDVDGRIARGLTTRSLEEEGKEKIQYENHVRVDISMETLSERGASRDSNPSSGSIFCPSYRQRLRFLSVFYLCLHFSHS